MHFGMVEEEHLKAYMQKQKILFLLQNTNRILLLRFYDDY